MNLLSLYGWTQPQQDYYTSLHTELLPGRVISISGFKYFIITEKGELETELSGKLLFENENEFLPKVGDWVLYMDYETMGYIIQLLPRMNALSRKNPGAGAQKQLLAANVDYAVIVQGVDRDFNLMRLDRYIAQVLSCGIKPIVLLNKADLAEDPSTFLEETKRLGRDCPVFLCSTVRGDGLETLLEKVFAPRATFILIGSSGVGKSSLLNALMQGDVQKTGDVSSFNSKGKHTTTRRELFVLPNGAIIIDTPGMREFGMTFEDSSDVDSFPVVQELAKGCRFSDCTHTEEKDCAVLAALHNGELDPVIYESYMKLIKEQRRFQITADEKKRSAKQFGKITREANNHRKKYKF